MREKKIDTQKKTHCPMDPTRLSIKGPGIGGPGRSHYARVSGIWYLVDPPKAPTQSEGVPENAGLPTATWRLTRSRQGGSKRAAHACTLRHQGLTPAVVSGWRGGGLRWCEGCAGCPEAPWAASVSGAPGKAQRGPWSATAPRLAPTCFPKILRLKIPCWWRVGFRGGISWLCGSPRGGSA